MNHTDSNKQPTNAALSTVDSSEVSKAWHIISGLITGMRVDAPQYIEARDWLNKNRRYQIVSSNQKVESEREEQPNCLEPFESSRGRAIARILRKAKLDAVNEAVDALERAKELKYKLKNELESLYSEITKLQNFITKNTTSSYVYELVDCTDYETYYPTGLFRSLENALAQVKNREEPPIDNPEDFVLLEVRERQLEKLQWAANGKTVATIKWVRDYIEARDEWVWHKPTISLLNQD